MAARAAVEIALGATRCDEVGGCGVRGCSPALERVKKGVKRRRLPERNAVRLGDACGRGLPTPAGERDEAGDGEQACRGGGDDDGVGVLDGQIGEGVVDARAVAEDEGGDGVGGGAVVEEDEAGVGVEVAVVVVDIPLAFETDGGCEVGEGVGEEIGDGAVLDAIADEERGGLGAVAVEKGFARLIDLIEVILGVADGERELGEIDAGGGVVGDGEEGGVEGIAAVVSEERRSETDNCLGDLRVVVVGYNMSVKPTGLNPWASSPCSARCGWVDALVFEGPKARAAISVFSDIRKDV